MNKSGLDHLAREFDTYVQLRDAMTKQQSKIAERGGPGVPLLGVQMAQLLAMEDTIVRLLFKIAVLLYKIEAKDEQT